MVSLLFLAVVIALLLSVHSLSFPSPDPDELVLQNLLMDKSIRGKTEIPFYVLVAPQSSGKSLFIDFIVGYPISFNAGRKAILCPIRLSLRNSQRTTDKKKKCTVAGVAVALSDVRQKVEEHMDSLYGKFSLNELFIEIHDDNVWDIDIMDLPGYPSEIDPLTKKCQEF